MGTLRMGDDAERSVVDRRGRFHEVENLWCADASVFVTSGGHGPTLTLEAFALRLALAMHGRTDPEALAPMR